jgi:nicotinamide phosphoribosyltransferase
MSDKFAAIAPLTHTDAYKLDHRRQYPKGTTGVLSNYTNRGSRIEEITAVVHFGLQAFLESWAGKAWEPFWAADEDEVAALYEEFTTSIVGPNDIGSDHIRALHRLGYLPLVFKGLPEGTLVPLRVPSFTVENTLPEFYWLVNYIETALSAAVWHPSTSATTAHRLRVLLDDWAIKTTGSTEGVQWQGHDFSFRGMSGIEAAAASGAGHLLSFTGSDNLHVVGWVNENYPGDNGLILGSVPATEHSVMCAGGSDEGEEQKTYERLIDLYPAGIVSVVSDTWDLWNVLTNILPALKDRIMARDGKLVVRPDSGDPVKILTGTLDDVNPAARKGVVELLWDVFGGTVNEQGYKVLDPHIGTIYGDSITYDRAEQIAERLAEKGFASTNVVFGVGSYTYQYVTRDTFQSAIKATWVEIDGEGRDIFKNPKTDSGMKKSAKGRVAVVARRQDHMNADGTSGDTLWLLDGENGRAAESQGLSLLKTVWRDGKFVRKQSYAEIRAVLEAQRG